MVEKKDCYWADKWGWKRVAYKVASLELYLAETRAEQ